MIALLLIAQIAADAGAPAAPPAPVVSSAPAPAPAVSAAPAGLSAQRLAQIQAALQRLKLDGWLFFDFRRSDEIAYRILGLGDKGVRSRRWYCLIPAHGAPRKLVHAIEPEALDGVPGSSATYTSWRIRDRELGAMLRGLKKVAMEYTPRNELPTLGRVDAGTVELVHSLGPEVVSSADLVAELVSTLSPEELSSQARAAELLVADLEATAQEAARRVRAGNPATEYELQQFAQARWTQEGLGTEGVPLVAADAHTADPHYLPRAQGSAVVARNSVLLLDFAAALGPGAIPGDLTRVYFLGESVPSEVSRIAAIVFQARDAALRLVEQRAEMGKLPTGAEVDTAARSVIDKAGYAAAFLHRTGHNIGLRTHGDGVNNDDFETHDTRRHLPDTCFSIEPGIYLAGRFGIRSEIDVCLPGGKVEVRGPGQTAVPALLAP